MRFFWNRAVTLAAAFSLSACLVADKQIQFKSINPVGSTTSAASAFPISVTFSSPTSPAASVAPIIHGNAPSDAVSITFYSDALCTSMVGSATPLVFGSTGTTIAVSSNSYTSIYAQYSKLDGSNSECGYTGFDYVSDSLSPYVPYVTASNANGFYAAGATLSLQVVFSETVFVDIASIPVPTLQLSGMASNAVYVSGSGTNTLNFSVTVSPGDNIAPLEYLSSSSLALNGTVIRDAAMNPANLLLPTPGNTNSLSYNKSLIIDTNPPSLSTISAPSIENTNSINLAIAASAGPSEILISTSPTCSTGTWEPYFAILPYSLSLPYGTKTLYGKVRDPAFNESACIPSNAFIHEGVTVNPVYMGNGANWGSYVKFTGSGKFYNQPDAGCLGSETAAFDCMHAGEMKKAVLTGCASCSGILANDTLNVFNWLCDDTSGTATLYTGGFQMGGKGLKDLIAAGGTAWNSIGLQTSGGCSGSRESLPRPWWNNTVSILPNNSSGSVQSLSTSGTVYTLPASQDTAGYNLDADGISLVLLNGAVLRYNGSGTNNCYTNNGEVSSATARCLLSVGSQKYTWIEGTFQAKPSAGSTAGVGVLIAASASKFNKLHEVSIQNAGTNGILLNDSSAGRFMRVSIGNSVLGINLTNSSQNIFHAIRISNSSSTGFMQDQTSAFNSVSNILLASNNLGLEVDGYGFILVNATSINNVADGIVNYGDSADNNTFHNILSANNGGSGLYSAGVLVGGLQNTTVSQIAVAHNFTGIDVDQVNSQFNGNILIGNNSVPCNTAGSTPGINSSCTPVGTSTGALMSTSLNLVSSTFIGMIGAPDSVNTSENGIGQASYTSLLDWTGFENAFRLWGKNFTFGPSSRGNCSSGTCSIWDWRLSSSDTMLLNKSDAGITANPAFSGGSNCPTAGSDTITNVGGLHYLRLGMEIAGDHVGNDNGLCETGENCLYNRNTGAYQGDGASLLHCNFTGSSSPGVDLIQLYALPANGGP